VNSPRYIAAFDSGLGGLSALAPLLLQSAQMKLGHHLNYLGDLANLPYGPKSKKRIRQLVQSNLQYLVDSSANPKPELLIIACNTASAFALDEAREICAAHNIACVGVIEASCKWALSHKPQRILVLSTKATLDSHAYPSSLKKLGYTGEVVSVACPLFVPFVEEGVIDGPALQWVIQKYLAGVARPGDLAILGCTHYPFISDAIQKEFPFLKLVNAGDALLKESAVQKILAAPSSLSTEKLTELPRLELQFTDDPDEAGKLNRFLKNLRLDKEFSSQTRQVRPLI